MVTGDDELGEFPRPDSLSVDWSEPETLRLLGPDGRVLRMIEPPPIGFARAIER